MEISDFLIQELMDNEFDKSTLHVPLFKVNIRLLKINKYFFNLINSVIEYMSFILNTKFGGYTQAKGISGANLGIPWNIIGIHHNNKNIFFINPVITKKSEETKLVKSNCGSIRLKELIDVNRHIWIDLEYYDIKGNIHHNRFFCKDGGYTIQHEVEHNLGILITDIK